MAMMTQRRFADEDQRAFAAMSGDFNPIHLDPLLARRTLAGGLAVHGVHLLVWALDRWAAQGGPCPRDCRVRAAFRRFTLVGEEVRLSGAVDDRGAVQLVIEGGGTVRAEIAVTPARPSASGPAAEAPLLDPARTPWDTPADAIDGLTGRIGAMAGNTAFADAFPAAAAWLGAGRLAAIAATTRLVGMVAPGLHSIFTALDLTTGATGGGVLSFVMSGRRHGLVTGRVSGGGVAGTLTCMVRQPPYDQPGLDALRKRVAPDAFAGTEALVIGGSRGLGELTAKLIAAGGGRVAISYSQGQDEARRVAGEIKGSGGRCTVLRYGVGDDTAAQLAALPAIPAAVYYFASPPIARPGSRFFDAERLAVLERFFVTGFWSLAAAVAARRPDAQLFYPSTVYIDERPAGMAEYAMAKAAGEQLCAEITATMAPMRVLCPRLPRLPTDQTVGVLGAGEADAVAVLLPHLHAMQRPG